MFSDLVLVKYPVLSNTLFHVERARGTTPDWGYGMKFTFPEQRLISTKQSKRVPLKIGYSEIQRFIIYDMFFLVKYNDFICSTIFSPIFSPKYVYIYIYIVCLYLIFTFQCISQIPLLCSHILHRYSHVQYHHRWLEPYRDVALLRFVEVKMFSRFELGDVAVGQIFAKAARLKWLWYKVLEDEVLTRNDNRWGSCCWIPPIVA